MNFNPSKYLAFKLTDSCKNSLLELVKPQFEKVICHHITLFFNGDNNEFNLTLDKLGVSPKFEIVGMVNHDEVQCFIVELNGNSFRTDGSRYHITHSISKNRKPVDSNRVIKETFPGGWTMFKDSIKLDGNILLINK